MKGLIIVSCLFICCISWSQNSDTLILRKIDSLLKVAKKLKVEEFEKAIEINNAAGKLAIEFPGQESAIYASCCSNRGRIYFLKGNYEEGQKWFLESKLLFERLGKKDHPDYAVSITGLAAICSNKADYKCAEPLLLEVLAIKEKNFGKNTAQYATSLMNLATIYSSGEEYEKAVLLYKEALLINEQTVGKNHISTARILYNLSVAYYHLDQYENAINALNRTVNIQEKELGKMHPDYGSSLNILGLVHYKLFNPDKAENCFLEALSIMEKTIGINHFEYAQCLNNLATLQFKVGFKSMQDILDLRIKSKDIREKVLGKNHPDYIVSLNDIASIYRQMKLYDKAEELYREALDRLQTFKESRGSLYGHITNNLGMLYRETGDYNESEKYLLESLHAREKANGKNSLDYTESLMNLSDLFATLGNYQKALGYELEANQIIVKLVGKEHDRYLFSIDNLTGLYILSGNTTEVVNLYSEYLKSWPGIIKKSRNYLSSYELGIYLSKFQEVQNRMMAFMSSIKSSDNPMSKICFDYHLMMKEFQLEVFKDVKRSSVLDTATNEILNEYKQQYRTLGNEYTKPEGKRKNLDSLRLIVNVLEKELVRKAESHFGPIHVASSEEIYSFLGNTDAVIEFVNYTKFSTSEEDSIFYAALILTKKHPQPLLINLFDEKHLKELMQINSSEVLLKSQINEIYSRNSKLYDLIWRPIINQLNGIKNIFYSASGLLYKINLNAIPTPNGELVSDRLQILQLGSIRSSISRRKQEGQWIADKSKNNTAVLVGGVEYEFDSTEMNSGTGNVNLLTYLSPKRGDSEFIDFGKTDSSSRGGNWLYLKNTKKEVEEINAILKGVGIKSKLLNGYQAKEEIVKSTIQEDSSPVMIHIATHGYFFPDSKEKVGSSQLAVGSEPVFKISDHPMIRSGLILAGGNHAWKTGKPFKEGMEDGILTAYEISQMNLSNTELVVLSACETGLGDIQGNEGVYGLQRAFKIAGAKYIIMSLWQVPDKQTSQLMIAFYKNWLNKKMNIPEAFHAAQKELRSAGLDPYQWAGFVLIE